MDPHLSRIGQDHRLKRRINRTSKENIMEQKETVYLEPKHTQELPDEVVRQLQGDQLESRAGEAIRLSTVGEDGWPHAAQLSVGEILAVSPTELLVAIWHGSHTADNLRRDGRVTLSLVSGGALLEIREKATLKAENLTASKLAVYSVAIERVNEHRSTYADVVSGVTFRLHDEARTLARWREQIAALNALL
jgi:uncharacterized protein YndB with AHSA1/START domain